MIDHEPLKKSKNTKYTKSPTSIFLHAKTLIYLHHKTKTNKAKYIKAMKKLLSILIILLSVNVVSAQEVQKEGVKSMLSGEIGLSSGVSYEQRLGSNFTTKFSIGMMNEATIDIRPRYLGITPYARMSTRWYASAKKYTGTNNQGLYIGLDLIYLQSSLSMLMPTYAYKLRWSVLVAPTIGYNHDLSDRWSLKGQLSPHVGAALESGGLKNDIGRLGVLLDFGLSYRF